MLANRVSGLAFGTFGSTARERELRGLAYAEFKAEGLGAQAAQHVIKRVVDAYSTLRGVIGNGAPGVPQSRRRRKAESKPNIIKRVVDAYSTLRGLIGNGALGGPQSRRRRKAESKPVRFRPDAAHT